MAPGPIQRALIRLRSGKLRDVSLPKLEVIWLPRHLFDIRCVLGKNERNITAAVDSYSGMFTVFEMQEWLVDGEPSQTFAPYMPEKEAESLARRELLSFILRQRGTMAKPEPRETAAVHLIHYPYWVYYFDGGGFIDIRVLDAVTGERGGGKAKRAVLNAFAHHAETKTAGANTSKES